MATLLQPSIFWLNLVGFDIEKQTFHLKSVCGSLILVISSILQICLLVLEIKSINTVAAILVWLAPHLMVSNDI